MTKTNQEAWDAIYDVTGSKLFPKIIQAAGPGNTLHVPKDAEAARRKARDREILSEFYGPEFEGMTNKEIYTILAKRHDLSPDRIRKIISKIASGSR